MARKTDAASGLTFGFINNISNWGLLVNTNFQILAYKGTHLRIKSLSINTPPSSPAEGDVHTVGDAPTGAWSGWDEHSLAIYGYEPTGTTLAWFNAPAIEGSLATDAVTKRVISYFASDGWVTAGLSSSQISSIGQILTIEQIITGINSATGTKVDYNALANLPTPLTPAQLAKIRDAITSINTDATITGDGSTTSPLAVATPFTTPEKTKLGNIDLDRLVPTGGAVNEVLTRDASGFSWQPSQQTGNTFTGVFSDATLTGTGADAQNPLSVTNEFTTAQETKLAGIATGAQVNPDTETIATQLNAATTDAEKIDYDVLKNKPDPQTSTAVTPNQRVEQINLASNFINYERLRGAPDGTVDTDGSIEGDGSTGSPLKLTDDDKTKLSKLRTNQPEFLPTNYQADLTPGANIQSNTFNYVKGVEAFKASLRTAASGITSVASDGTLTGVGTTASPLAVATPFTTAEKNKLGRIESGATGDQTAPEISALLLGLPRPWLPADAISGLPAAVQADWNAPPMVNGRPNPAYIRNKPPPTTALPNPLPVGGATGQVLKKSSSANYAVEWADDEQGSGGNGLSTVSTDTTISGDGSTSSPLSVATPFTADEKNKLANLDTGLQIPSGGRDGQVLTHRAGMNDFAWDYTANVVSDSTLAGVGSSQDPLSVAHPIPRGGTRGQVLKKSTDTNYDYAWEDDEGGAGQTIPENRKIPSGGTANQVLTKDTATNYDVSWQTFSGLEFVSTDNTIDGRGTAASPIKVDDSIVAKIDEVYDLIRGSFMFQVRAGLGDNNEQIGFANFMEQRRSLSFGGVVPSSPNPPTFEIGGNTYRVLKISTDAGAGNKNLEIFIGGINNAATSIPDLPDTFEITIGTTTYRRRDFDIEVVPKAMASDAYIQLLRAIGSRGIFTANQLIDVTIQLTTDANRLLPTGGMSEQHLTLNNNLKPTWTSWREVPSGGDTGDVLKRLPGNTIGWEAESGGTSLTFTSSLLPWHRYTTADVTRPEETATNLFHNVVISGSDMLIMSSTATSRTLSKINKFNYPDEQFQTQLEVSITATDLMEGYIHGGNFYSLRATTTTGAAKVLQPYALSNFVAGTPITIANASRLGDTIGQGWSVTADDTHYWISNQYGKTNMYLKSDNSYQSVGDIDPTTGTNVTYACTAVYDDWIYLISANTAVSSRRQIDFTAYSKAHGGRVTGQDFLVVLDNQTEWASFNAYGGAEIAGENLYLVTGASAHARTWAKETPSGHIKELALDAVGTALEAGDHVAGSDINFVVSDTLNRISATIKPGVIVPADIARDPSDTTKASGLAAWKALFDIGAGGGVSTATGGAVTKLTFPTSAPARVLAASTTQTIRTITLNTQQQLYAELDDYNIYEQVKLSLSAPGLNNHIKVQAVKGATGTEVIYETPRFTVQTGTTVYSVVLPLGSDDTSYRLQAVNLSDTNAITMAQADSITYPRVIGVENGAETVNPEFLQSADFHQYDDAESFAGNSLYRGAIAFNAQKNVLLALGNPTTQGQNPDTGVSLGSDWEHNVGGGVDCCWDTTGRYLYVLRSDNSFRVYDIGTGATPSWSRVTSKEFTLTTVDSVYHTVGYRSIFVDSTRVIFLITRGTGGGRDVTKYQIWSYSLSGTLIPTESRLTLPASTGSAPDPRGLVVTGNFENIYVGIRSHKWIANCAVTKSGQTTSLSVDVLKSFPVHDQLNSLTYKAVNDQIYYVTTNASAYRQKGTKVYDKIVDPTATKTWQYMRGRTLPARANFRTSQVVSSPTTDNIYMMRTTGTSIAIQTVVTFVDVITSINDTTVARTSRDLSGHGFVAFPFFHNNKLYFPHWFSATNLFGVDVDSWAADSSPTTLSGMTGTNAGTYITQTYGDETNFWVLKGQTAYAFAKSDFSRVSDKDLSSLSSGSFLTGNETHIFACTVTSANRAADGSTACQAYLKSTGARDTGADTTITQYYTAGHSVNRAYYNLYWQSDSIRFPCFLTQPGREVSGTRGQPLYSHILTT